MRRGAIVLFSILLLLSACKGQNPMIDKTVVKEFDIEKYLGIWYEISRYNHRFERGMVGVTATYSYRDDGKIKVVNSGYRESFSGEKSEAIGKAKIPNLDVPSKLKVSFFWFFYGDYFILELDEKYEWAVIGSSNDNYLWILSRAPEINEILYADLLDKLTKRGYDVTKLIKVPQQGD